MSLINAQRKTYLLDNPIYQPIEVNLSQLTEEFQIIGRVIWGGKRF
ncbi:hypothetical protein [Acaryochloris sp. CCMEE 5410]|nr:hypothetical protein [Acaryochloris sp. CCMEE 5410]